jgi:hypothetical protein
MFLKQAAQKECSDADLGKALESLDLFEIRVGLVAGCTSLNVVSSLLSPEDANTQEETEPFWDSFLTSKMGVVTLPISHFLKSRFYCFRTVLISEQN